MSDVKVTGPAAPTPTPTSTTAGPGSAGAPGALGLGIDIGVVVDPTAGGAYETPAHEADGYDKNQRPTDERPRDDTTVRSGRNPFENVRRQDGKLEPRRVAGEGVDLANELDPSLDGLAKLASMEASLGAEHPEVFAKLREGLMLLTSDGQAMRGRDVPVDLKGLQTVAQKLLSDGKKAADSDFKAFARQYAHFLAGGKNNVQAFVQRVLRECYQIQNELLWDEAAKVRHYNELKKATRERLTEMRQLKTAWASQKGALGEGATFVADPPIDWMELDSEGEWHGVPMTADDVASWKAVDKAASSGLSGGGADYDSVYGESGLSADDRDLLQALKKKDRGWFDDKSDDFIRDRMEKLLPLLPKMNKDDIEKYLMPIIEILSGGNADEEELLEIFGHLSPTQFLLLFAGDADPTKELDKFAFDMQQKVGGLAGAYAGALTGFATGTVGGFGGALIGGLAGAAAGAFGFDRIFNDAQQTEFDLLAKKAGRKASEWAGVEFDGKLTAEKAAALLVVLKAKHDEKQAGDAAVEADGSAPGVGSPKVIRTVDEIETYIKELESNLNSIGDDAQLANVDMQGALQKQQHTLQMLSNMAKMLHDTAMAIVRRLGQ